jgi:hypothetical protein
LMRIWDNIDVWPDDLAVSPSLQSSARALRDLSKIRLIKPRIAHSCVVPGHCSAASGATEPMVLIGVDESSHYFNELWTDCRNVRGTGCWRQATSEGTSSWIPEQ